MNELMMLVRRILSLLATLGIAIATPACGQPSPEQQRNAMVDDIARMARALSRNTGKDELDERVLRAMAKVPRHEFVPEAFRARAYENRPLPIGEGQTISQPFIVALMTDLAGVDADSVVLEIGTGSGYQAAILAELAARVHTIEIVEPLGRRAAETLERLGYDNVFVRIGDGYRGWPEAAPFDAIVVTAAPDEVPRPLLEQLAPRGRLVIPVGAPGAVQSLRLIEKDAEGRLTERDVLPVAFVPFTRETR
ncbi:MAG: protein-L-isoaspartate(D-aspartate) O-methyltransferase [Gammaproteobacteria bacterium]|nr:protein-L-isoaspartate O-methyltransferase [Gammaproteobacteria bacterium]